MMIFVIINDSSMKLYMFCGNHSYHKMVNTSHAFDVRWRKALVDR